MFIKLTWRHDLNISGTYTDGHVRIKAYCSETEWTVRAWNQAGPEVPHLLEASSVCDNLAEGKSWCEQWANRLYQMVK